MLLPAHRLGSLRELPRLPGHPARRRFPRGDIGGISPAPAIVTAAIGGAPAADGNVPFVTTARALGLGPPPLSPVHQEGTGAVRVIGCAEPGDGHGGGMRDRPFDTPPGYQNQMDSAEFPLSWNKRRALIVLLGYSLLI